VASYGRAILAVQSAADALDRAVQSNPSADPRTPTAASGRALVGPAQTQVDAAKAAWASEVQSALAIQTTARSYYDAGIRALRSHGAEYKPCVDPPWVAGF